MGKINSRTKGSTGEREFAKIIHDWSGIELIRNLEQTRSGGHDLIVAPDEVGQVADNFRTLAIECKRYNSVTDGLISKWWAQARRQAESISLCPVLAYRGNRQEWRVVVPLYLINQDLCRNHGLDCTATVSLVALCQIVREI